MPDNANAILFLHAITGLHLGSGTALGVVDLPVQRERHTHWPVIPGSSLKGVLRDSLRNQTDWQTVFALFGPETGNAAEHAGALAFTDARILAFPVRSLKGVFAWVTCPAVLERLARDLRVAGFDPGQSLTVKVSKSDKMPDMMLCAEKSPILIDGKQALLEEFEFTREGGADKVAEWLSKHAALDGDAQTRLRTHLAVLHDDDFTHFVTHATEVTARVGLDHDTRTVKTGALFWEEFLPPETLMYALVLAQKSRREAAPGTATEMLARLRETLPKTLQIGAGETIGKGLCLTKLLPEGGK